MPRFEPATFDLKNVIRGNLFQQSFELPAILPPEIYFFECQVRLAGSTQPVLTFSSKDGSIVKAGQVITLHATADRMRKVQPGKYRYDIKFFTTFDDVQSLLEGVFVVKSSTTVL